jgi:hypothetical protein
VVEQAQMSVENAKEILHKLYTEALPARFEEVKKEKEQFAPLAKLYNMPDKPKKFDYEGVNYPIAELENVYTAQIDKFNEAKDVWLTDFDAKVFAAHYLLLPQSEVSQDEFLSRYQFHLQLQESNKKFQSAYSQFYGTVNSLMQHKELTDIQMRNFTSQFDICKSVVEKALEETKQLQLPPMKHTEEIKDLSAFLLDEKLVNFYSSSIDGEQINKFGGQIQTIINRTARLCFKSMGGILKMQEQIFVH